MRTMARNCSLLAVLSLAALAPVSADDWKIYKQQGRDYVSFANVAQFYKFPEYTRASRSVSLRGERRSIRAEAGFSEITINGVRFLTDFPVLGEANENLISAMDVRKIIEPILRPSRIQGARKVETVVLDPGHGGADQGASNAWGTEKMFTLDVALTAREQLLRAGFKVEMTRTSDVAVSLEDRVRIANQFQHALFISIHFNSANGGAGVETYALAPSGVPSNASSENHLSVADLQWYDGNAHDEENIALAAAVHAAALTRVAAIDRGVRHARFHVLRGAKIPAVLFEGGFLSNPYEGSRIAAAGYRQQLGAAIAQAVQSYNSAVNFLAAPTDTLAARNLQPHESPIAEPLSEDAPTTTPHANAPSIVITGAE